MNNRQQGFTIIEMFVTLALLGALAAIAVPNLTRFVENQRVRSNAQQISSFLSGVRGEALTNLKVVRVCWNSTAAGVDRNGVTVKPGFIAAIDRTDDSLVRESEFRSGSLVHFDNQGAGDCFHFEPSGRPSTVDDQTVDLGVCKSTADTSESKLVRVDARGRILTIDNSDGLAFDCSSAS